MVVFLLNHLPGCSPLTPCPSCEAASFLRSKLEPADFETFLLKVKDAVSRNAGPYSGENPAPLEAGISVLSLSIRSTHCLSNSNKNTIGDVVKMTEIELLRLPNFGRRSLDEVKEALAKVGRKLGDPT